MNDRVTLTPPLIARLRHAGVECLLPSGIVLPGDITLEPPCSLKYLVPQHSLELGAFSYMVSGFCAAATIGRYTSLGEQVQLGRHAHPTGFLSTSPALFRPASLFNIGTGYEGAAEYAAFRPAWQPGDDGPQLRPVVLGNDVYVGHGAFILPGVTVADGAIIGANAVVTKDVPPYAVVAGSPATIRKFRLPVHAMGRLLALEWWRFAPWQLQEIDISQPLAALKHLSRLLPTLEPYEPTRLRLADFAEAPE